MAEGGPPEYSVQKSEIADLLQTPLKKGDTWYLIDAKWFKQWKKYVGFDQWDTNDIGADSAFPSFIDNTPMLKDGTQELKDHLIEELDHVLLPADAWNKLVKWYGLRDNQEPIARKVIEQGMFVKQCKVEVYLMDLKLARNNEMEKVLTKQFSRADRIDHIEKEMRLLFNINDDKDVRLWNKYMTNTYEHLDKPENTLQDAGLYQGQMIVIEQKNEDGSWPRQTKSPNATNVSALGSSSHNNTGTASAATSSTYESKRFGSPSRSGGSSYNSYGMLSSSGCSTSSYNSYSYDNGRTSSTPGLCGLNNMGNTCFMNSAIQCMSNVPELTDYFIDDKWMDELNQENPLGMHGEIAKAYAELIQCIWSGRYTHTVPKNFKLAVSRFAPQFSGYQQHDSQELMAFLLDGLHEDLNRIKHKPYVELKDANGRPDEVVAREAWFNYKKRNDSIITDTFHALLKSTLICPQCDKVSITFDPFCYLSLPLPIKKERYIEVVFMPLDPLKKPMQYKLTVPKSGCVGDLCKALSRYTHIAEECMVVVDVYNHRFHRIFTPEEGLTHILDRDDIFIYEVQHTEADDEYRIILPVYMRERKVRRNVNYTFSHVSTQLFGTPLLVSVPKRTATYQQLKNIVLQKMSRYVHLPQSDDWWKEARIADDGSDEQEEKSSEDVEMNQKEDENENDDYTVNNKDSGSEETPPEDQTAFDEYERSIFTFALVNSYGSSELDRVADDDKPIRLSSKSHLAVDWNIKAKKLFFDEKESEMMEVHDSMHNQPSHKKQSIPLHDCLDLFTTRERLGAEDPWFCPDCKKHQQATKQFDLWQLPNVLIIHLKRFSYERYLRDKLDVLVDFPIKDLNMKQWIRNPGHGVCTYDLLSVVNHYGGLGGGHYTAYCRNRDDEKWYHFDDSSVTSASEDAICTKAAYVLVYQRRDITEAQKLKSQASAPTEGRVVSAAAGAPTVQNGNYEDNDDEMDIN